MTERTYYIYFTTFFTPGQVFNTNFDYLIYANKKAALPIKEALPLKYSFNFRWTAAYVFPHIYA